MYNSSNIKQERLKASKKIVSIISNDIEKLRNKQATLKEELTIVENEILKIEQEPSPMQDGGKGKGKGNKK